ncbi:MAG: HTTM domain-containing protein [Planctomycetales bacterium]|nr:HTTM domain-containing protein [Planctomycetales bacterium]
MSSADTPASRPLTQWTQSAIAGWDRFWFTPAAPHTLSLIRILAGGMLLYTHLVWALDLMNFLGPNAWITADVSRELHSDSYAWSYLWYVESPAVIWTLHVLALAVFALFTAGCATRITSVLAFLITVSYSHRLIGAQYGLDQVNAMLAMYLMIGASGAAYSVDSWLAKRHNHWLLPKEQPAVSTNVAIRLIQLHMCVIYLFGGIGKLRGDMWWDGSALWYSAANLEYQSLNITWLGRSPILVATLSHVTMFWETFYCVTIWPRWTRPITLALAFAVHGGIALSLGMITFGLMMIFGNLAFVSPEFTRRMVSRITRQAQNSPTPSPSSTRETPPPRKRRPR